MSYDNWKTTEPEQYPSCGKCGNCSLCSPEPERQPWTVDDCIGIGQWERDEVMRGWRYTFTHEGITYRTAALVSIMDAWELDFARELCKALNGKKSLFIQSDQREYTLPGRL